MDSVRVPREAISKGPVKFICHSKTATRIAVRYGWFPGARYTNLRDIRGYDRLGFLDIDWKNYSFKRHLEAAKSTRPMMTVAEDITKIHSIERIIDQAFELQQYCDRVVVVPKNQNLMSIMNDVIPQLFVLGYSVPTRYGSTNIPLRYFRRPIHLLGGRPDNQRRLAEIAPVISLDCNRFTIDAAFGDFFDGSRFRRHPKGGYTRCLSESISNINKLWNDYEYTGSSECPV